MHGARRALRVASLQRTPSGRDRGVRDWTYPRHEFWYLRDSGSELLASFWCDYSDWEEPPTQNLSSDDLPFRACCPHGARASP